MDALLTAVMLADSINLELAIEILRFLHIVLEYKQEWCLGDHKSYINIMVSEIEVATSLKPRILIN